MFLKLRTPFCYDAVTSPRSCYSNGRARRRAWVCRSTPGQDFELHGWRKSWRRLILGSHKSSVHFKLAQACHHFAKRRLRLPSTHIITNKLVRTKWRRQPERYEQSSQTQTEKKRENPAKSSDTDADSPRLSLARLQWPGRRRNH